MDPDLVKGLITAVPVILSPIIVYALSRSGVTGNEARMDYLIKRLDLISRLHQMQSEIDDPPLKELFQAEFERCKRHIASPQIDDKLQLSEHEFMSTSRLARFFLMDPSQKGRHKVLRGFFYVFMFIFVIELIGSVITFISHPLHKDYPVLFFATALFYLLLGLGFRVFAVRRLKTQKK
jgi:hypothetical protein